MAPRPVPLAWKPTVPAKITIPLPIIDVLFKRVGMDLIGPLPKAVWAQEYILMLMDYTMRYPDAIPLWKATSKNIARELFFS